MGHRMLLVRQRETGHREVAAARRRSAERKVCSDEQTTSSLTVSTPQPRHCRIAAHGLWIPDHPNRHPVLLARHPGCRTENADHPEGSTEPNAVSREANPGE